MGQRESLSESGESAKFKKEFISVQNRKIYNCRVFTNFLDSGSTYSKVFGHSNTGQRTGFK